MSGSERLFLRLRLGGEVNCVAECVEGKCGGVSPPRCLLYFSMKGLRTVVAVVLPPTHPQHHIIKMLLKCNRNYQSLHIYIYFPFPAACHAFCGYFLPEITTPILTRIMYLCRKGVHTDGCKSFLSCKWQMEFILTELSAAVSWWRCKHIFSGEMGFLSLGRTNKTSALSCPGLGFFNSSSYTFFAICRSDYVSEIAEIPLCAWPISPIMHGEGSQFSSSHNFISRCWIEHATFTGNIKTWKCMRATQLSLSLSKERKHCAIIHSLTDHFIRRSVWLRLCPLNSW